MNTDMIYTRRDCNGDGGDDGEQRQLCEIASNLCSVKKDPKYSCMLPQQLFAWLLPLEMVAEKG